MEEQHHIIQQQVMHIDFFNKEDVQPLYARVSALVNDTLSRSSERIFNRLVPEDLAIKIDSLSIDLGTISYAYFEQEFTERYEAALEKELLNHLRLLEKEPGDNIVPVASKIKENYMAFMRHFLLTGTLPWWATGEKFKDVRNLFDQLLKEEPGPIKQLLLDIGIYYNVRYRLAYQFPEQTVQQVVTLLEPGQAPFIFDYHTNLVNIQQKEQVVNSETHEFEKAVWLFILTYLLADKGSHFNRKMFVKSTLFQMAAHFNSSYEDILFLFSEALHTHREIVKEHDNLLVVIHELSTENSYTQRNRISKHQRSPAPVNDYEQLSYFFLLGSLPLNSTLTHEQDLVRLFTRLKQTTPTKALQLLMHIGKHNAARKRMVQVFDEVLLQQIITFAEPAHAEFILNSVVAVNSIPKIKTRTGANNNELKQLTWEFVLYFLFEKRDPVFEQGTFLESIVYQLARHYAIPFKDLLVVFIQGMGEDQQLHNDNSQLFYVLTGLLKAHHSSEAVNELLFLKTDKHATTSSSAKRNIQIRDTLLYWLNYNAMPWWAGHLELKAIPDLFEELHAANTEMLLTVLKFAFQDSARKHLFLATLPQALILKLISKLPGSNNAKELLDIITGIAIIAKRDVDADHTRVVLVATLLEVYTQSDFGHFEQGVFLTASVQQLAAAWNLDTEQIIALFIKIIQQDKSKSYPTLILNLFDPDKKNSIQKLPGDVPVYNISKATINAVITQLKKKHSSAKALVNEALAILSYFLVWNKLPEEIAGSNTLQTDDLLRELVKLLVNENRMALRNLLLKKDQSIGARLHLHHIFSGNTALDAKAAQTFLAEFYKADVLSYLREKSTTKKSEVIYEALAILRYFLIHNKLPEEFAGITPLQSDAFLRELFLLALSENKSALHDLLTATGHSALARMHLHDLFIAHYTTGAEQAKNMLVDFFRADVIQYLREKNIVVQNTAEFNNLLDLLLKQAPEKNSVALQELFKAPALLHLIARQYRDEKFYTLIRYFVNEKDAAFIRGIRYVLDFLGADKAGRESLGSLLREFSLFFFMEGSSVFNRTVFINRFFAFLYSKNQLNGIAFYELLQQAKSKLSGFTNVEDLGLILMEMTGEAKKYADKEKINEVLQQELKKAAEKAITDLIKEKQEKNAEPETEGPEEDPQKKEKDKEEENMEAPEKIYVKNAGLVILHPLLGTYFHRVNLMEDGKFIDKKSQLRAVHLLQYLVWETENNPEEELALNKLLCGLSTNTPVANGIEMTDHERSVSHELINVVLMQWDKLKNTSAESFKTSFLQREGLLFQNDEDYTLRVEQRGYDVLLQSLPWNLGMIKTSWMQKPLITEWI